MTLGENLIRYRKASGRSRKQAAEELEIPYNTLSNYEANLREPGSEFLKKVSRLYRVTVDELLGVKLKNTSLVLSEQERALISLWRDTSPEGQQAAVILLQGYKKDDPGKNLDHVPAI